MPSELKCRIIRARILRDDALNHSTLQGQGSLGTSDSRHPSSNTLQSATHHHQPLEIICELKFNEEVQTSAVFQAQDETKLGEDAGLNNMHFKTSVWQGKLSESYFRFEMVLDDETIQLKTLEIKVCEVGSSSNDCSLGLVQIDLSPLLFKEASQRCEGWFPIYSVDRGITGELFTEIQLDYTPDRSNDQGGSLYQTAQQMKQINFFSSKAPTYFEVHQIMGFVEELVDIKIEKETSKTSDTDLQIALQRGVLDLRKRLGEIVKKKNGNAIITYRQSVEYTGEYARRIVLRGYGTAILALVDQQAQMHMLESTQSQKLQPNQTSGGPLLEHNILTTQAQQSAAEPHHQVAYNQANVDVLLRNTDGQHKKKIQLITTDTMPGELAQNYGVRFGCAVSARAVRKLSSHQTYEQAQSRRLTASKIASEWNQWWGELRQEIYKSAKQLNCTHVLGYREVVDIQGSVSIFSAYGTAVRVTQSSLIQKNLHLARTFQRISKKQDQQLRETYSRIAATAGKSKGGGVWKEESGNSRSRVLNQSKWKGNLITGACHRIDADFSHANNNQEMQMKRKKSLEGGSPEAESRANNNLRGSDKASEHSSEQQAEMAMISNELKNIDVESCKFCHLVIPSKKVKYPQQVDGAAQGQTKEEFVPGPDLHRCLSCGERYVPEVIIATINPPDSLKIIGRPQFLEARAIKVKKTKNKGSRAKDSELMSLSDSVFLIEYDLHNQLLTKLKLAGKNALFCYRTSIKINSDSITGLATGTAVCLQALPLCKPIKIVPNPYLEEQPASISTEVFRLVENLSVFNIKGNLKSKIVSIQSPYTYVRDLPKKRVIQNLVATQVQQQQNRLGNVMIPINTANLEPATWGGEPVKVDVKLQLSAIPETNQEGKSMLTPQEKHVGSGPKQVQKACLHKMTGLDAAKDQLEISCDIDSSQADDDLEKDLELNGKGSKFREEDKIVVLFKDVNADSPPKRLDFSGLKPDNPEDDKVEIGKTVQFRSGSLSEKKSMDYLISKDPSNGLQQESPAVLVIRQKKHSLDERDVSQQLECDTYKIQRLQGATAWKKETLLKETQCKQPNRRGLQTITHFAKREKLTCEEIVKYYNTNSNFVQGSKQADMPTSDQDGGMQRRPSRYLLSEKPELNFESKHKNHVVQSSEAEAVGFENSVLSMILKVNDQNDIMSLQNLIDPLMPPSVVFLTSYYDLINYNFQKVKAFSDLQFYARMFRLKMFADNTASDAAPSRYKTQVQFQTEFNLAMQRAYKELALDLIKKKKTPCVVCALRTQEKIHDNNTIDVFFTCSILKTREEQPHYFLKSTREESKQLEKADFSLPSYLTDWWKDVVPATDDISSNFLISNKVEEVQQQQQQLKQPADESMKHDEVLKAQTLKSGTKTIAKNSKKKKESSGSGGGFFSFLFCGSNRSKKPSAQYTEQSTKRYSNMRNVSADESIRLLPMSVFPGMTIRQNFGLVDVHLIRRVYLTDEEFSNDSRGNSSVNRSGIELAVDDIVADLNELVRTRVRSLGGNCLIGYKVSINGFEQNVDQNEVYLIMSAIGDAVLLLEEHKKTANTTTNQSSYSDAASFTDRQQAKQSNYRGADEEELKIQDTIRITKV